MQALYSCRVPGDQISGDQYSLCHLHHPDPCKFILQVNLCRSTMEVHQGQKCHLLVAGSMPEQDSHFFLDWVNPYKCSRGSLFFLTGQPTQVLKRVALQNKLVCRPFTFPAYKSEYTHNVILKYKDPRFGQAEMSTQVLVPID